VLDSVKYFSKSVRKADGKLHLGTCVYIYVGYVTSYQGLSLSLGCERQCIIVNTYIINTHITHREYIVLYIYHTQSILYYIHIYHTKISC